MKKAPAHTNTRKLRAQLGLTQREFAKRYHVTLGALLRWERNRSIPSCAAATLLRLIEHHPQGIAHMLAALPPIADPSGDALTASLSADPAP